MLTHHITNRKKMRRFIIAHHQEVTNDRLSYLIIKIAFDVQNRLGPNMKEHTYREALCFGLNKAGLKAESEVEVPVTYRGKKFGARYIDLLVEDEVVVELKAVKQLTDRHFHQLGTNTKLLEKQRGLLLNFGEARVKIRRFANSRGPDSLIR